MTDIETVLQRLSDDCEDFDYPDEIINKQTLVALIDCARAGERCLIEQRREFGRGDFDDLDQLEDALEKLAALK